MLHKPQQQKMQVQGYTLGNAFKKFKIDNIDLLKMVVKK